MDEIKVRISISSQRRFEAIIEKKQWSIKLDHQKQLFYAFHIKKHRNLKITQIPGKQSIGPALQGKAINNFNCFAEPKLETEHLINDFFDGIVAFFNFRSFNNMSKMILNCKPIEWRLKRKINHWKKKTSYFVDKQFVYKLQFKYTKFFCLGNEHPTHRSMWRRIW